jgi:hypothetical protein
MLANAKPIIYLANGSQSIEGAGHPLGQLAPTLLWLGLAALILFVAVWLFRRYVSATTGRDPKEFLMSFGAFKSSLYPAHANSQSRSRQGSGLSNPGDHRDVRSSSAPDRQAGGAAPEREELRAILREVVREELERLRAEISADLQGSLRALSERIEGIQVAQRPVPPPKPLIETPASRSVLRGVTETDLISYWHSLREANQISAWHFQDLASKAGLSVAEASGLAPSDPLHRLGFLLTDGQGTIWFIPRPASKVSELSGAYIFPENAYLPGAISGVMRFARWQNGQISTPGEAR